jgi:hypothetical protein
VLTNGLRRAEPFPTRARQLEDEGYVLPRPRAAFVAARLGAERNVVLSRSASAGALTDLSLPVDNPTSEGRR